MSSVGVLCYVSQCFSDVRGNRRPHVKDCAWTEQKFILRYLPGVSPSQFPSVDPPVLIFHDNLLETQYRLYPLSVSVVFFLCCSNAYQKALEKEICDSELTLVPL